MRAKIANSGLDLWAMLAAAILATLVLVAATQMEAQSFTVLHTFTAGADGANPSADGLAIDAAGNLCGATSSEGAHNSSNVFKLSPANGGWTYSSLYDFTGGSDGSSPGSGLVIDGQGNLFGTTYIGGSGQGYSVYGVVFEIAPN